MTRSAKAWPYWLMAERRAACSLLKASSVEERKIPSRSWVLVAMAAGMAEMGELVVPA